MEILGDHFLPEFEERKTFEKKCTKKRGRVLEERKVKFRRAVLDIGR